MKKFLPVLISICAVSCINACDDSQKVVQGSHDDSLPNVKMEVHIDDVKQGDVNVQDMADFVQSVTASGETSNAIAISDFIQQINNVPDNELDAYLAQYLCDYQSYADNMRPTDKGEKCAMVSCTEAKRSYYNVESENMFYADDAPMKAGCYRVKNLGKILMYKANPNSAVVWVYTVDDQGKEKSIDIDLDIMEAKTQVGGSDAVKLSELLKAAGMDSATDFSKYYCDFRVDDAKNTIGTDKAECSKILCSTIIDDYISSPARSFNPADTAAAACFKVDKVKAVYVSPKVESYEPYKLKISVDGTTLDEIDVSTLTDKIVNIDGKASVKISDIFAAAGVTVDLAASWCDYIASDGWKPSKKDQCSAIRTCADATDSYVTLNADHKLSNNVTMAENKNCYNVTDLAQVVITTTDPNGTVDDGYIVKVVVDKGSAKEVDITKLNKDNDGNVAIADILAAAGISSGLAESKCEAVSVSGNYRPSSNDRCAELLTCDKLASGVVSLDTHKVSVGDVSGCYQTSDVDLIEVTTAGDTEGYIVEIYVDNAKAGEVDITKLPTNSGGFVDISTILDAAELSVDLTQARCEGGAEDGYRPSTSDHDDCNEMLSCTDFAKGDVSLDAKHKLVIKDVASCYGTKFLNRIYIVTE